MTTTLNVKKLHPQAQMPVYATTGAARFDISAIGVKVPADANRTLILNTGLAFEIPEGFEMVVVGRSGLGFKHNIRLANCEGIIDSDYRDELLLALTADTDQGFHYLQELADNIIAGVPQRIAQGKIQPAPQIAFQLVDELSETSRKGGFGSTGTGSLDGRRQHTL